MTAPTLFDEAPKARASDPSTAHEAARIVQPGNSELITEIRVYVAAGGRTPVSAFQIAEAIGRQFKGRWSEASVRTAVSRAGLWAVDTDGVTPRGRKCLRYLLRDSQ